MALQRPYASCRPRLDYRPVPVRVNLPVDDATTQLRVPRPCQCSGALLPQPWHPAGRPPRSGMYPHRDSRIYLDAGGSPYAEFCREKFKESFQKFFLKSSALSLRTRKARGGGCRPFVVQPICPAQGPTKCRPFASSLCDTPQIPRGSVKRRGAGS